MEYSLVECNETFKKLSTLPRKLLPFVTDYVSFQFIEKFTSTNARKKFCIIFVLKMKVLIS